MASRRGSPSTVDAAWGTVMDSIETKLVSQLSKKFGGEPGLNDGLAYIGVDSIGMAELTVDIEKEFGIQVSEEVFAVETVQELANYIRDRQRAAASS